MTIENTPGEYVAQCPECGAQAVGRLDQEPPGHLHELGEEERQRFVEYVRLT